GGQVLVEWFTVAGLVAGYKVYGRTAGSEQLIATVGPGTNGFVDNGIIIPNGALPTANTTTLATDQRGKNHVGNADIGAFETQGFQASSTGSNKSAAVYAAFASSLVETISSPSGEPVVGGVVTFTAP